MGSGLSVDKAKNATETLNESTLNQVKKSEISCAQKVEQFQNNELENIKTGGGDLTINQYSGIVSNCVLESKSQEQLINDIAAEVAQKIKTDKGAAAAFSLVSVNEQENTNKISQVLKQNYSDIAGLKCDIDVLQSQQNKLRNIDTGGGSISLSQGSNVQSDCSLIASVNRTVANSFTSSTDQ